LSSSTKKVEKIRKNKPYGPFMFVFDV
jgi:hypothetical protein